VFGWFWAFAGSEVTRVRAYFRSISHGGEKVAGVPCRFTAVRTSEHCQPRARFVDFDRAAPSAGAGWKVNEVIRVPSAACATQQAQVQVWRKPAGQPVALDQQGRNRVYLGDAKAEAEAGALAALPAYAARLVLVGKACGI
jgi:hypothetical protein